MSIGINDASKENNVSLIEFELVPLEVRVLKSLDRILYIHKDAESFTN